MSNIVRKKEIVTHSGIENPWHLRNISNCPQPLQLSCQLLYANWHLIMLAYLPAKWLHLAATTSYLENTRFHHFQMTQSIEEDFSFSFFEQDTKKIRQEGFFDHKKWTCRSIWHRTNKSVGQKTKHNFIISTKCKSTMIPIHWKCKSNSISSLTYVQKS